MTTRILTLGLAAIGIAAVPAAHAQSLTLNSGDSVTVSSAGTQGTIGGKPIANSTTSYSAPSTPGSGSYAVRASGTSTFTLGAAGSLIAEQGSSGLVADGSGAINITGGVITVGGRAGLIANGSGAVTVTGGTFTAGQNGFGLLAEGNGLITLFSQGDTPFLIDGVAMNNKTLGSYTSGTDTISGTLLNGDVLNTTFYNSTGYFKTLSNLWA